MANYIPFPSSMFPISDQTDFMSCNDLFQQMLDPRNRQLLQQDQELPLLSEATNTDQIIAANKRRRNSDENCNDNKKKRIVHRGIERQRRQEMTTLHQALRSQLPVEYLKGKRSVSDHIHKAVNYIKHLKSKIEELRDKRGHLSKLSDPAGDVVDEINVENDESECCKDKDDTVTVSCCMLGVEVVMKSCAIATSSSLKLSLSRVLKVLVAEGLTVVRWVSARVNERLLHTIESLQVIDDGRRIDASALQKKLTNIAALSYSD